VRRQPEHRLPSIPTYRSIQSDASSSRPTTFSTYQATTLDLQLVPASTTIKANRANNELVELQTTGVASTGVQTHLHQQHHHGRQIAGTARNNRAYYQYKPDRVDASKLVSGEAADRTTEQSTTGTPQADRHDRTYRGRAQECHGRKLQNRKSSITGNIATDRSTRRHYERPVKIAIATPINNNR
jgi:hypothetical protein